MLPLYRLVLNWVADGVLSLIFNSSPTWSAQSQTIRLSVYRVRKTHKQKLIGMCETTMHNILNMVCSDREAEDGLTSEKCFYLQRSMHKLQQVGQLRVKAASLVTLSGRTLDETSLAPLSPSSSAWDSQMPGTPSSVASLERSESLDTTTTAHEDPFNVDLKQLSIRFSSSHPPAATPEVTLNDFLDSGGQLDFCVAIDFTSSNGKEQHNLGSTKASIF